MKHFFCLLIFCVRSFFVLNASEEIALGSNKPPVTQANLSGIPNACVAGKVNAVTGDFVQYDIDFAIPTANPLLFERTYSSSFAKYGSLSLGCNLNHFTNLLINSDGDNHFKVRLNEGQGALTEFRGKYPYTPIRIFVNEDCIDQGMTNCGRGEISGRTNVKNFCFFYDKKAKKLKKRKTYSIYEGSGTHHFYRRFDDNRDRYFFLRRTIYPNGNTLHYNYLSETKKDCSCKLRSPTHQHLAGFSYASTSGKKDTVLTYTLEDLRQITYTLTKSKDYSYLTQVVRPELPTIKYSYDTSEFPRIIKKELPDERCLEIDYWSSHRVRSIKEPVGTSATPIKTYEFYYSLRKDSLQGTTQVFDVYQNKTIYEYDKNQRLTSIKQYGTQTSPYRKEKFYWGNGKDKGNLVAQAIINQNRGVELLHTFTYDATGNPLQESIYGNLTGENLVNPLLGNDLKPVNNACEFHVKTCTFSGHPYNLKLSESEGSKKTIYTYYPGKDQLKTQFVYEEEVLQERCFYEYNDQGMLIQEIIDDGIDPDQEDLSYMTQRRIRTILYGKEAPVYLPLEEKFQYLDKQGQTIDIGRIVNHYDAHGHLTIQDHHDSNDSLRYRLHWEYDAQGNVIGEVNAVGEKTTRRFDSNKNLIFEQGPNQPYHLEMTYDYMNRQTCVAKVDNNTQARYETQHQYDKRNRRIATIDMYGNQTTFEYDNYDRLVKTISPPTPDQYGALFHAEQLLGYDVLGYQTLSTDGNGNTTEQKNTIRGQPYLISYPDGSQEQMIYNLKGTLAKKIERNGMSSSYSYDYKDRPLMVTISGEDGLLLGRQEMLYDAFNSVKETDAEGNVTTYEYDRQGQLYAAYKGTEATYYFYDALGRKNRTKTYYGSEATEYTLQVLEYDLKDRVAEERIEDSSSNILRKETYGYDGDGNKTRIDVYSSAGFGSTFITYDIHQQPTQIQDAEGYITRIHYRYDYIDSYGVHVPYSEMTDPKGNITITIGNAVGKTAMIQRKNSFGELTQQREYIYDGAQQLVLTREKVITPNTPDREILTHWKYNSMGEITDCIEAVGTPEQKHTQHTFNPFGQKSATHKPDGTEITYSYDGKGRLATISSSDKTLSYAYSYDQNDNPIQVSDLIHQIENHREYEYDRLVQETLGNGLKMTYAYDRQGRLKTSTLPDQSQISYLYNATDLVEVKKLSPSKEELYSQKYAYDQGGNLTVQNLPFNLGSITHTYDRLKQPLEKHSKHFHETNVHYDSVGNLTSITFEDPIGIFTCHYDYDPLYQLSSETGIASHTYQHDSVYNRCSKDNQLYNFNALNQLLGDTKGAYTYDLNGNLIARHNQAYTYDAWDRLITVTEGTKRYSYQYDDLNRRLSKIHAQWNPLQNTWTSQETHYFLYEKDNEIGVCDEEKHFHELRVLGYGRGAEIGAAIAYEIEGEIYVPLHQAAGHTRVLLNAASEPVEVYRYSAFGEEVILDPSGTAKKPTNAWRYCSKRTDPETGFIYFGRRYYDPQTARWITADPLGYETGPNLYAYLNNNPLTHLDLYGLFDWMEYEQQQINDRCFERQIRNEGCCDFWHGISNRARYMFGGSPEDVLNGSCYNNTYSGRAGEWAFDTGRDAAIIWAISKGAVPAAAYLGGGAIGRIGAMASRLGVFSRFGAKAATEAVMAEAPTVVPKIASNLLKGAAETITAGETLLAEEALIEIGGGGKLINRFIKTADNVVHDLKSTLDRIFSGGKFPHRNDGSIFKNLEGLLPKQHAGYYKEFVHPTPGVKGPGAMRIVTGKNGEIWFSPDHYKTFIPIK